MDMQPVPKPVDRAPPQFRLPLWPAIVAWVFWTICMVPAIDLGQTEAIWNLGSVLIWGAVWVYWRINREYPSRYELIFFKYVLPLCFIAFHFLVLWVIAPLVFIR
jgi:hypothetical protein